MPSRLHRHDEPNHIHYVTFCCYRRLPFFRHDGVCYSFIDAMRKVRHKLGIRWLGYVIMPEHVHLLVLPQEGEALIPIATVLNHLKGWSGRLGKEALRSVWASGAFDWGGL